jgi:hypothetical protein
MPRKRSSARRRRITGVEEWQLNYILTGERPSKDEEGINPFVELVFISARPGEPDCRHGGNTTWFELWGQVKDDPLVIEWQKKHGKTYAERLLEAQT